MDFVSISKKVLDIEIDALEKCRSNIPRYFPGCMKILLESTGKIVVVGIGKSGFIAKKIAATLCSVGNPAVFLHPAEAMHGDLGIVGKEDVVIILSYSGETPEILKLIPALKRNGNKIISITNSLYSTLSKNSDSVLPMRLEREACSLNLAPTASSIAMLAIGDMIAIALMEVKGFTREDFAKFHPGGSLGKELLKNVNV